jgi:hypothetical protein
MFAGQVITGAMLSTTVTLKLHVAVKPLMSVTLNAFVVTPTGYVAPDNKPAIWTVVGLGQLSVPTGAVYVTTAEQSPGATLAVTLAGHIMPGACVSRLRTADPVIVLVQPVEVFVAITV